jgi:hypothetical protein
MTRKPWKTLKNEKAARSDLRLNLVHCAAIRVCTRLQCVFYLFFFIIYNTTFVLEKCSFFCSFIVTVYLSYSNARTRSCASGWASEIPQTFHSIVGRQQVSIWVLVTLNIFIIVLLYCTCIFT